MTIARVTRAIEIARGRRTIAGRALHGVRNISRRVARRETDIGLTTAARVGAMAAILATVRRERTGRLPAEAMCALAVEPRGTIASHQPDRRIPAPRPQTDAAARSRVRMRHHQVPTALRGQGRSRCRYRDAARRS